MSLSVSVVINTYNRAGVLGTALAALEGQRFSNFEVVVVNGPSTDETEAVLDRWSSRIRIGFCPETNLSRSRNIGAAMARGDVVAFLDDDAAPEPDWLNELLPAYRDPDVAGAGGWIRDHTGTAFQSRTTVCDRFGDATDYGWGALLPHEVGPSARCFISPTGANASYRRDRLMAVGGFDEWFAYFLDETDVNVRLIDQGWRLASRPTAEVHHKYAPSHLRRADKVEKSLRHPARSKAYFCVRHGMEAYGPERVFERIRGFGHDLRRRARRQRRSGLIDAATERRLLAEVDGGLTEGVERACAQAQPELMADGRAGMFDGGKWRPFRPSVSRRPAIGLVAGGSLGGAVLALAEVLRVVGAETTVISDVGQAPTVEFVDGLWIHQTAGGSVQDEVRRVHLGRGLDLAAAFDGATAPEGLRKTVVPVRCNLEDEARRLMAIAQGRSASTERSYPISG